jgi:putative peptide modification system cyclase
LVATDGTSPDSRTSNPEPMTDSLDLGLHWPASSTSGQPVLRNMVVCDLSDSTALVERLGDRQAAALLRKHDRLTRALIDEHGGREIDKTDGYLLLFERPTQAVAFALAYHRGLRYMSEAEEMSVTARVGIHVGDVVMWENTPEDISRGAKPVEVEGLAKPVAARLASLARPRQILLSGVAATIARRGQEEITEECPDARWHSHGTYRIRGVAEPTEVVQIGEPEVADFTAPNNRVVAHRILPFWRRPSTLSAATLLLIAIVGSVTWLILRQPPSIAFAARDWAVIANVENQTGQSYFNNTIDTAIRIGMQQSRYVNVISNAKVQQTLALMQRDQDTKINVSVGSEIAIRDNARALIVPRIRNAGTGFLLSASLIDPETHKVIKTVVAKADSNGDVVASVDHLVKELRQSLGESMAQIKGTTQPLERVMTPNLEALRAYSLADQAGGRGDYHLSQSLVEQAIELDPHFASAYALQAANYISLGYKQKARESINKALQNKDRLTSLEQMKVKAEKATISEHMTDATLTWKVLADLYPDDASGANNVGLYYAGYLNDCDSALPYLKHAASLPQSKSMVSTYIGGTCELSTGKAKAAIESLKKSYSEGFRGPFLALADAYVETRQYANAVSFLAKVPNDSNTMLSLSIRRALVVADQGDLSSAESNLLHGLNSIPPGATNFKGWPLRLDLIGVLWGEGKHDQALRQSHHDLSELLSMSRSEIEQIPHDYPTLVLAFSRWAARLGDVKTAREALSKLDSNNQLRGYPIRSQLAAITRAELALQRGDPNAAMHIASAANTHPIWELLEVLARAKAAAGRPDAMDAYERVIDSRPLAFGELYENELGICSRAVQWNIAVLDSAEYLARSKSPATARQASIFLDFWKQASPSNPYIKRAKILADSRSQSASDIRN